MGKYNVNLDQDPSKDLLLSSLFKTLGNTEICSLFETKQKSSSFISWSDVYPVNQRTLWVLTYDDGGFTSHFMDKVLSDIFHIKYSVLDLHRFEELKQSPD